MYGKKIQSFNPSVLNGKTVKIVTTKEAVSDSVPFPWHPDVLAGKRQVHIGSDKKK